VYVILTGQHQVSIMDLLDTQSGLPHIDVKEYLLSSFIDLADPDDTSLERDQDDPIEYTLKLGSELIQSAMEASFPYPFHLLETGSVPENVYCTPYEKSSNDELRLTHTEADFMVVIDLDMITRGNHVIQDIEGSHGFLRVELTGEINPPYSYLGRTDGNKKLFVHEKNGKQYLSGEKIIQVADSSLDDHWNTVIAEQIGVRDKSVLNRIIKTERNGPALTIIANEDCIPPEEVKEGVDNRGPQELDCVMAIKLPSWPSQAAEWLTRKRVWPPQEKVDEIIRESAMAVVKVSPEGDPDCDWRLSFSKAEIMLVSDLDSDATCRLYAYRIFKYIIKRHVIPRAAITSYEPQTTLASYHLKTILLWMSEIFPPEYWSWENLSNCYLGEFGHFLRPGTTTSHYLRESLRLCKYL